MDVPVEGGLLVVEVVPGGPAAVAGIRSGDQVVRMGNTRHCCATGGTVASLLRYRRHGEVPLGGDIITAINGERMANLQELIVYLETETQVEDRVEMTLIRSGQEMKVCVTLAERAVTPEQF